MRPARARHPHSRAAIGRHRVAAGEIHEVVDGKQPCARSMPDTRWGLRSAASGRLAPSRALEGDRRPTLKSRALKVWGVIVSPLGLLLLGTLIASVLIPAGRRSGRIVSPSWS